MPPGSYTARLGSRPLAVSATGVVGVFLIHALLLLPFVLDLSLPSPPHPNTTGAGATAFVQSAEPDMTVVFIDEPTPANTTPPPQPPALASRGTTPPHLQLVVLSPDPSPASTSAKTDSSDTPQEAASVADAAEHARLYGRYLGQLQARIERAWLRPRTEIGSPEFSCRVRVRQDRRGDVVSADLDRCNGTGRWQQSLLSAVRTASPLPAPPDASVYADVLWLSFTSEPFEEGGSTQGFEPEARLADARDRTTLESFQQFANGSYSGSREGKANSNVIHLTIIGGPQTNPAPALPPEPEPEPADPQSPDPLPQ